MQDFSKWDLINSQIDYIIESNIVAMEKVREYEAFGQGVPAEVSIGGMIFGGRECRRGAPATKRRKYGVRDYVK